MKLSRDDAPNVERPPRLRVAPSYAIDDGTDACDFAAAYGYVMDDWQRDILRCWLGRTEDDKYASKTCGVLVPRQNGKNAILEVRELYGAVILGEHILHTAHEVKTGLKAFDRMKKFFGEKANDPKAPYPELNAMVKRIRSTNGQEAIILKEEYGGGTIEFSARSTGAARGFTVDVTIYDEAQALLDSHINASLPAKSAAPSMNPQTIYTGTPPTYGSPAEVFGRVRKNALAEHPRMCWHEWSVPEIGDVSDRERWYACNPAMPHRISEETVEEELENMSEDGFAMERLCWWPEQRLDAIIDKADWAACAVRAGETPDDGLTTFAIKFDKDGKNYAVAACIKPDEGAPHVEIALTGRMSSGMGQPAKWLADRKGKAAQIVVDGRSNAQAFVELLSELGVPKKAVIVPNAAQAVAAYSLMKDAITERNVTHLVGQEALDDSATKCGRRKIGAEGGWGFQENDEAESIYIEAVCFAYWSAKTTKRKPGRKARLL